MSDLKSSLAVSGLNAAVKIATTGVWNYKYQRTGKTIYYKIDVDMFSKMCPSRCDKAHIKMNA